MEIYSLIVFVFVPILYHRILLHFLNKMYSVSAQPRVMLLHIIFIYLLFEECF